MTDAVRTVEHVARTSYGRLVGYLEARGPDVGLTVLTGLQDADIADYQRYWAVRGHPLARAGRSLEARVAYDRAVQLSDDAAVRRFLLAQAGALR